jgi:hypothetical protein
VGAPLVRKRQCKPRRHGHAQFGYSRTYRTWEGMIQRCENPKAYAYERYGGLGITICERWRADFRNFLADMGERPADKTLDRWPDCYGNYEPGNCRWATRREQNANRRRLKTPKHHKRVQINGAEYPMIHQAARALGVPFATLYYRLRSPLFTDCVYL